MSDSISYDTSPLKYHQNLYLSISPNPISMPFFSRELLVRYTLPHTARTKSVVHQNCMYGSPFTVSRVLLCFPWSVQVVLLFPTTPGLWTACLWAFCRNGAVILPPETPLPRTVYSPFSRHPNKLNKPFPELHLYDYSIWIPKGIQQPKFLIHRYHTKV